MRNSENSISLSTGEAIELYSIFRTNLLGSINLHREHSQHYLMFIAAVITATIVGASQIDKLGKFGILLLIGPLLNIAICFLAVKMADRFYKGFLEEVTVAAKLEDLIGLTGTRQFKDHFCYKDEKTIVPDRWVSDRAKFHESEKFVSSFMNRGANFVNRLTFLFVGLINFGAILYMIYEIF